MIVIVAIVVTGPKELPSVLRKLGRGAAKLRRMAGDLRIQSGIDDVLRTEGIHEDLAEIRKLARGDLSGAIVERGAPRFEPATPSDGGDTDIDLTLLREHEYPRDGVDTYGALPETAPAYGSATSPLAKDPLYALGDTSGVDPPSTREIRTAPNFVQAEEVSK